MDRSKRLKRLIDLQATVKEMHEMRRAGHLAAVHAAEREAEAMRDAAARPSPLADLTAALYPRHIAAALAAADAARGNAAEEARRVALEKARGDLLEQRRRAASGAEERAAADQERLEVIERAAAYRLLRRGP